LIEKQGPGLLPDVSALAALRVLFPRTVEAIVCMCGRYNDGCAEWKARWSGVTKMRKELAVETRLNQARRVKWKARGGPCACQPHPPSASARVDIVHSARTPHLFASI
jgi:hypothetical protein